jgi:hypothetical protein
MCWYVAKVEIFKNSGGEKCTNDVHRTCLCDVELNLGVSDGVALEKNSS